MSDLRCASPRSISAMKSRMARFTSDSGPLNFLVMVGYFPVARSRPTLTRSSHLSQRLLGTDLSNWTMVPFPRTFTPAMV